MESHSLFFYFEYILLSSHIFYIKHRCENLKQMPYIKPFFCVRPASNYVKDVAALPYDVYNRMEAYDIVKKNPLSFLSIDRAETNFDPNFDLYSKEVYIKAASLLNENLVNGIYIQEKEECLYLYELIMNGRSQTGIVGCASVDEYLNGIIKKHENTRVEKEIDRTKHINLCNAHTGPIFLAYRTNASLQKIINAQKSTTPLYDFISEDGIRHIVYRITDKSVIQEIQTLFAQMDYAYIADGHHRAAAAANVARMRRDANPKYSGYEEFNYFLSVFFSEDELHIMDYNRVVKDLNGLTIEEILKKLSVSFKITKTDTPQMPAEKGSFTMFLDGTWYLCKIYSELIPDDPITSLDVSLLQEYVLSPIFGIGNPREDKRIDFVGGIRGLLELERRCKTDCKVAFAMYPTSIQELFAVADADLLMPPKSTWFEPKLRSGLFVHQI